MGFFDFLFGQPAVDGEGSSPERPIRVGSVRAEYKWVQRNCPGYTPNTQSLQNINGAMYDVLELKNERGEERTIYFDITPFFGK